MRVSSGYKIKCRKAVLKGCVIMNLHEMDYLETLMEVCAKLLSTYHELVGLNNDISEDIFVLYKKLTMELFFYLCRNYPYTRKITTAHHTLVDCKFIGVLGGYDVSVLDGNTICFSKCDYY